MAEVGSTFVSVVPSARGFGSKLDAQVGGEVKSSGSKAGKVFGGAMKLAAGAAIGGGIALAGFLKGSLDEAREAQKVGALTNAVIKSTGGVANVTAKQVGTLASSLSKKIGVDDEAIQAGENMLLTFGNVRNEVGKGNDIFNQATIAASDMAAAFGGDAVSNSKMLGKALNDPTKGVSALTRVGVSFTQQQKDQIKKMQESGNLLGAQKIILGEVSKQTKGAAEATATMGDKAKVAFGNLQETVGTALLPLWDKLLGGMANVFIFLTENMGPAFTRLGAFIQPAKDAIAGLFSGGSGGGFLATIKLVGTSIATNFLPVLRTMATTFTTQILPVLQRVGAYILTNFVPIFQKVWTIIATQVVPIIARLAQFFYGTLLPAIIAIVVSVGSSLKPVFDALVAALRDTVLPIVSRLLAKFAEWWPTISKVILIVVKVIGVVLRLAAAILGKVLPPLIRFAAFLIGTVVGAIVAVIGVIVKIVAALISFGKWVVDGGAKVAAFATKVGEKVGEAADFVAGLPGAARDALGNLGTTLKDKGAALIQGLIDGIVEKIEVVKEKIRAALQWIKDHLPGSPIKRGPLKPWNNTGPTGPGGRLMGLLGDGISNSNAVESALTSALSTRLTVPRVGLSASVATSTAGRAGAPGASFNIYESLNPSATAREVERHLAFAGGS